jgi:hypothetical protein
VGHVFWVSLLLLVVIHFHEAVGKLLMRRRDGREGAKEEELMGVWRAAALNVACSWVPRQEASKSLHASGFLSVWEACRQLCLLCWWWEGRLELHVLATPS